MRAEQRGATPIKVLLVDDEETIRVTLGMCLETCGHQVTACATASDALANVSRTAFDLIFLDLRLGIDNGMDLIPRLLQENPWAKIVVITAYASIETAVEAIRRGATDYLPKPFTPSQVELVTMKVAQQRQLELKLQAMQEQIGRADPEDNFATASAAMRSAVEVARKVAGSKTAVLIEGELGTGKERLAKAIHTWSDRGGGPFAVASCVGRTPEALEEELFGVGVPASWGGSADAPAVGGRVGFCAGGTLLLREITEVPLAVQPKLVRLLRDREYERVGEFSSRSADCRVIATTRIGIDQAVKESLIRPDLALAANVISIRLPPLRERREDILPLAERFLAHFASEHHRPATSFTREAIDALQRHDYPGNHRELRNLIERAILVSTGPVIDLEHLPPNLLNQGGYRVGDMVTLEKITDLHIKHILASTRSFESAASVLGINSITLWRRRKRYGA